ncbi:hypothetical protein [Rhizobium sp. 768_B6_N1_8]|uniref:hypothetical protein n=1 Tax=unclassified Rhizobium TaxID=2613769 RepID=UPI003F27DC39
MDRYEESMFDDLAFDEAEGAADSYDGYDEADEGDEYDDADEGDEFEEADEGDEYEASSYDEMDGGDEMDEVDEYEGDGFDEGEEEAWDEAMAYALGAEDTDEFIRRVARGVRRVATAVRRAAPTIGRIARAVAPVASLIPGYGTAIGRVANVVGQLMADEASEEESLAAFAELAVRNRAAIPLVAGMAARRVLGRAAARMPQAARLQAVRTVRRAANQLVARGGPTAIRALPRIANSVRRTAVARRTPPSMRPRVLAGTASRVTGRQHGLRRQLTRPLPAGRRIIQRTAAAVRSGASPARNLGGTIARGLGGAVGGFGGGGRRIIIRGPVTLSFRR